jgi:hypothetical protein
MITTTIFFERGIKSITAETSIVGVAIPMTNEQCRNRFMKNRLTPQEALTRTLKLSKALGQPFRIIRKF